MSKKVLFSSVITAAVAGTAAAVLFVPHTITVKEYMDGSLKDYKPQSTEVKTSLFDSIRNPYTVKPRNIDHAEYTGMTVNGNDVTNKELGKIWKDTTVSLDYKPVLYSADFKEGNVVTYSTNFQYGENPVLPKSGFLTSKHPYENFKEWKKEDKAKSKTVETGKEDLSVVYDAVYEGKTYKVTYDLDGGSAQNPDTYQYGKGIASFANASKDGYTFDGWFLDAGKTKAVTSLDKNTHGDQKLYAKFHENPKPVVQQSSNGYSGGSSYSGHSSYSGGYSAPAASGGASFPHIGNCGALTLSSGYSVALNSLSNAAVDAPYSAGYEAGRGNEFVFTPDGRITDQVKNPYTVIEDHNYGVPAALPATQNSSTMWLRHANGTVEVLHKTYTFRTASQGYVCVDGRDFTNADLVHQYGRLMFRTCDERGVGNVITIWN